MQRLVGWLERHALIPLVLLCGALLVSAVLSAVVLVGAALAGFGAGG